MKGLLNDLADQEVIMAPEYFDQLHLLPLKSASQGPLGGCNVLD